MSIIEGLNATQRRYLAIALLVVVVGAFLCVTVLPITLTNNAYDAEIEQLNERLLRLQNISSQDEELRRRYDELRRSQTARGYFLQGDSEAVASADLQRILKEITTVNGTQLMSTQILPATNEDGLTRVSLRVRVRGPLPGLVESIYDLESNSVLLFLDNVSLRTAVSIQQRLRVVNNDLPFEALFDLTAYMTNTQ